MSQPQPTLPSRSPKRTLNPILLRSSPQRNSINQDDSVLSDLSKFILENDTSYSYINKTFDLKLLESDPLICESHSQTGDFSFDVPVDRKNISMIQSSHSIKEVTDKLRDLEVGFDKWTAESSPNVTRKENITILSQEGKKKE